jgi:hypothetical protein
MVHTWPNVTKPADRARLARKARHWRRIDKSTDGPLSRVIGIRSAMAYWVDSMPAFPYR